MLASTISYAEDITNIRISKVSNLSFKEVQYSCKEIPHPRYPDSDLKAYAQDVSFSLSVSGNNYLYKKIFIYSSCETASSTASHFQETVAGSIMAVLNGDAKVLKDDQTGRVTCVETVLNLASNNKNEVIRLNFEDVNVRCK